MRGINSRLAIVGKGVKPVTYPNQRFAANENELLRANILRQISSGAAR